MTRTARLLPYIAFTFYSATIPKAAFCGEVLGVIA